MAAKYQTLSNSVEYYIADHTFTFESDNEIVIRDCTGTEQFRCDVDVHALHMEVVQVAGVWNARLGRPVDLPIGSPIFITMLDMDAAGAQVLYEKHVHNVRLIFVGTDDCRYECGTGSMLKLDNDNNRYAYSLSDNQFNLSNSGLGKSVKCNYFSDLYTSKENAALLSASALKASGKTNLSWEFEQ